MRKLVALVVIAVVASSILFGHRLIVNRTHSLPVGLYYWSDVPIKKGSIVLFKPDQNISPEQLGIERGYEARALPLLKRVVALAGDLVSVSSSGVSINEQLLPIKAYDILVKTAEDRKRLERSAPLLVAARDAAVVELKREKIANELANHNQRRPTIPLWLNSNKGT